MDTDLGEWYWDQVPIRVPWWAIAWIEPDEPDERLYAMLQEPSPGKQEASGNAHVAGAQVKHHRAPPRDRSLSTDTPAPNPALRVKRLIITENAS